jgi:hypothetical protein
MTEIAEPQSSVAGPLDLAARLEQKPAALFRASSMNTSRKLAVGTSLCSSAKVGWRIKPGGARLKPSHFAGHGATSCLGRELDSRTAGAEGSVIFDGARYSPLGERAAIRIRDIMEYIFCAKIGPQRIEK